jgi:hypothetical protein
MKRKIIFLDIDGVLSPRWWNSDKQSDKYGCLFDAKAVANLAKIVEETEADIVISSSWKNIGLVELQNMWRDRGLPGKIVDITPDYMSDELLLKEDSSNMDYLYERGSEIQGWLLLHGDDVGRYVIIDDMDDILPEQLSHFVQTDPEFGITIDDVKKIVHLLNN